jgi:hypothetical protein
MIEINKKISALQTDEAFEIKNYIKMMREYRTFGIKPPKKRVSNCVKRYIHACNMINEMN